METGLDTRSGQGASGRNEADGKRQGGGGVGACLLEGVVAQGKASPGVSPPGPDRQAPVASGPAADRHIAAARPQRRAVQSSARPGAPPLRRGYIGLGLA